MAEFPGPLGKKDYSFSFPLKLKNGSDSAVGLELDRVRLGDADILSKKVIPHPAERQSGSIDMPVLLPDSVPKATPSSAYSCISPTASASAPNRASSS